MEELTTIFDIQRSGLPYPPKEATKDVPVLLCLAGFPDSASVWNPLITHKEFQSTHHVIALGLPGYQNEFPPDHNWGYTVQEIIQELHKIVQYCHRQHPYKQATIHLVGHDWGAQYCYYYLQNHSDRIDKYVALDTGLMYQPDTTLLEALILLGYFLLFSLAFIVQTCMSKSMASLMIEWYPWDWVGPLARTDNPIIKRAVEAPRVTYPYFQLFKAMAMGKVMLSVPFSKTLPQCFVYGSNKNVMYHSNKYLSDLDSTPGCSWHVIEGAGHWFYTEPAHSQAVAKILSQFFLEK